MSDSDSKKQYKPRKCGCKDRKCRKERCRKDRGCKDDYHFDPDHVACCPREYIRKDIKVDTWWTNDREWVVAEEVHVRCGASLYIEKGTKVLFKACYLDCPRRDGSPLATLVVDSGASIHAEHVTFESEGRAYQQSGGLIILGTLHDNFDSQYQKYRTIRADRKVCSGCSVLKNVTFHFLGNLCHRLPSLLLYKVKKEEIYLTNISISFSGGDALAVYGGCHKVDCLSIHFPTGDGIDLNHDTTLKVQKQLAIERNNAGELGPGMIDLFDRFGKAFPEERNTLRVRKGACLTLLGKGTDIDGAQYDAAGSFLIISNNPEGLFFINEPAQEDTFIAGLNMD